MENWICMAGSAPCRRPGENPANMAVGAPDVYMRASQPERGEVVIEGSIFPVKGIMAGFTGSAISPIMFIILQVAGIAIFGRSLETFGVAVLAGHVNMFTHKIKICQAVIKLGWYPTGGIVAGSTFQTKPAIVGIISEMAVCTLCGRSLETFGVAALAGQINMFPHECKISQVVIKICRYPA
jgi:hypothetical protein